MLFAVKGRMYFGPVGGIWGYKLKENREGKASITASDKFVDLFRRVVVEKRKENVQTND